MVVLSTNFSAPATGVLFQTPGAKLLVNDIEIGTATLYITENEVVWGGGQLAAGGAAPTIALKYENISMHAVQRNPSPAFHVVLSYDLSLAQLLAGGGDAPGLDVNEDDEEFDAENTPLTKLKFITPDEDDLAGMYQAMNHGQGLHPDPEDEAYMDGEDVDEGDDESFEDAEESAAPEEAAARLVHLHLGTPNGTHSHAHDADADDLVEK